jgi:N-acetyl-anhydromuramyl-L-alanine amidase AmpD
MIKEMKNMPTEIWAPSPNFHASTRKKVAIVYHITAGLSPGCLNWMRNPVAQASAQYLVCRSGTVYQMVRDADEAWHAGAVNRIGFYMMGQTQTITRVGLNTRALTEH